MKKIINIVTISLVSIFFLFIIEECIRLRVRDSSKPLWVIGQTKYCSTCIRPGEELDIEYWGLGYKVKMYYYSTPESSKDNQIIEINYKEFLLFNKIRIWKWSKR